MPSDEPLFTYERYGFSLTVYRNRIDVAEKKMLTTKKETILLRQVASVEVKAIGGKLAITLADNTKREYTIGTQAEQARQAIVSAL